jgi:hypothetical protein
MLRLIRRIGPLRRSLLSAIDSLSIPSRCNIVACSKAQIGPPVHSAWLFGERLARVRAATESHPDLSRLADPPVHRCLLLACISQAVAPTAGEQLAGAVEDRGSAPAVATVAMDRTNEPRSLAAEVAGRPCDRHSLFDRLPLGGSPATRPIDQDNGIPFSAHIDGARRFSTVGPRVRKVLTSGEPAFAMPAAHIDPVAGLADGATTVSWPSHQLTSLELSKSTAAVVSARLHVEQGLYAGQGLKSSDVEALRWLSRLLGSRSGPGLQSLPFPCLARQAGGSSPTASERVSHRSHAATRASHTRDAPFATSNCSDEDCGTL